MVKKMPFTKMQGAGNDYVYINGFEETVADPSQLARKISDRHFGVGSDGLVLVLPSKAADVRMRMFNADGSEAEMCGNASRCVAKFAYEHGLVKKGDMLLETGAGIKPVRLVFKDGVVTGATVDMGEPVLEADKIPVLLDCNADRACIASKMTVDGKEYAVTAVSMGNPHAVIVVNNPAELDLPRLGPKFENHSLFPKRINTEFVEILSRHSIRMRVWERGAGETLACGTGACAALVACVLNGLVERKAEVHLTGGVLEIEWNETDNHVYMTGAADTVFTGEYLL